jgi:SpoVK/Ycf46/Vps4 family AAA+-type ATPase
MGYNKINNSDSKIIFIGATNYPKKVDSAMMDRVEVVMVGLPDTEAREFAFSMHFKDLIKLDDDIDFTYMAEKTEGYNYRDIDRVVENIKKNIFNEMSEVLRNESGTVDAQQLVENAVKSLDEGKFMLDKQRFDAVIDVFTPSNKTDIINDINDWLRMMNDDDPSRDLPKSAEPIKEVNDTPDEETDTVELSDEPQRMKEDIELFVSELEKQDSKEASVKTAENIQESDVQNSNTAGKVIETASTIAPIVEGLAESMFLDPVSGLVKVVFKIAGAVLPKVIAAFNGNNYEAKHEKDDLYSFSFKPDDSNAGQYSFDIMGDRGYIGTLEAKMDPPLGHPEFDI